MDLALFRAHPEIYLAKLIFAQREVVVDEIGAKRIDTVFKYQVFKKEQTLLGRVVYIYTSCIYYFLYCTLLNVHKSIEVCDAYNFNNL